jgi:hypothetical protein
LASAAWLAYAGKAYRQATLEKKPFQRQRLIDVLFEMTRETAKVIPQRKNP